MNSNILPGSLRRTVALTLDLLGFNWSKLSALRHLPRYRSDKAAFLRAGGAVHGSYPILADYSEPAGAARGQYFHQDLLVARYVQQAAPVRHIDVGSRIDGFVAHVASFRKIEVMDVRPLRDTGHENITFLQADLAAENNAVEMIADSVSSLHALEHFGLGRYGDPIDPSGHVKGFNNLCRMLKPGGTLYVSVPIGGATIVQFNAHRVFHPAEFLRLAEGKVRLEKFDYVNDQGDLCRSWPLLEKVPEVAYGCGIYTFRRD